ncbi:MAG: type VI secretion system tube protein Hcp [Planctomycetes bacterium]|nr:type VI secretion system tube protein Hcp [Planctomycetota bacterium]
MANAFYVHIEGATQGKLDGDVDQEGREKMIRGYRFESRSTIPRHADTGQPTGTRTHHPLVFSKHVDRSSPQLWQAMTSGESLKVVRFDFYRINESGENEKYYSITLSEAIVVEMKSELEDTSKATDLQAEEMREYVSLTFKKIQWEHLIESTAAADDWRKT